MNETPMTYINQIDNPSEAKVHTLKKIDKGLLLITDEYDCFLWKSSQLYKHIMEVLEFFQKNPMSSCELIIHPNPKKKEGFDIKAGKKLVYIQQENCWKEESLVEDEPNKLLESIIKKHGTDTHRMPQPLEKIEDVAEEAKEQAIQQAENVVKRLKKTRKAS